MEIPFDVEIPILIDNIISVLKHNSYARGYHAYMDIWKPLIGDDSLRCKREDDNIHDENAVAVIHSNHIGPHAISLFHSYILQRFKSFFLYQVIQEGCWLLERELTAVQDMA